MRRVAYLWSEELMRVADELPANQGRSRLVHGLIGALGVVDLGTAQAYSSLDPSSSSRPSSPPDSPSETALPNEEGSASPDRFTEQCVSESLRRANDTPSSNGLRTDSSGKGIPPTANADKSPAGDTDRADPVEVRVFAPDPTLCEAAELRRYHDASYVEYLLYGRGADSDDDEDFAPRKRRRKDRSQKLGLEYDCPPFPELGRYAALVAGATLTACRILARGEADTAIVWDGGRHHAGRAKASGFCYVADAVLGILLLCREGVPRHPPLLPPAPSATAEPDLRAPSGPTRRPRIMYLDLDLHYGDGVARAFACPTHFSHPLSGRPRPPQVLTLSVHHVSPLFFPPGAPSTSAADTPHPFNLSLGLAEHAAPPTYARLWGNVERIRAAWEPDYVVLQLGVDGLAHDPIGQVGGWGTAGAGGVAWAVRQVLRWGVPAAVLGGGGYEHANTARAWATATGVIVGAELPPATDVPDTFDAVAAFAPAFTLEVEPSHVPDKTAPAALDAADAAFRAIAERIREIRALHGQ